MTESTDHSHTKYRELLKILDTPNQIKLVRNKNQLRHAEHRKEILEKVWILCLDKSIEEFAAAIGGRAGIHYSRGEDNESFEVVEEDHSTTNNLYLAQKWDRYFAKKHLVTKKAPPRNAIAYQKGAFGSAKSIKQEEDNLDDFLNSILMK